MWLHPFARPDSERQPRRELARHVSAEFGRDLRNRLLRSRAEFTRDAKDGGGIGGPAAHPPCDRDVLDDLHAERWAFPAARPQSFECDRGEIWAVDLVTADLVWRRELTETESSSASEIDSNSVTSSCRPSARAGPRNRHRLTFAGARTTYFIVVLVARRAHRTPRALAARRAHPRDGPSLPARPAFARGSRLAGPRPAPATRRGACAGARNPLARVCARRAARPPGVCAYRRPGPRSGTGRKTVRATGRSTSTSHASWVSTERTPLARVPGGAASRSPTSRWTITTQRETAGTPRLCGGSRSQRSRRAGWR